MEQGKFLFSLMIVALVILAFASMVLQAASNQSAKRVKSLNAESVRLDRQIAGARDEFSRLVRVEVLQAAKAEIFPNFQTIKLSNKISLDEIPGGK